MLRPHDGGGMANCLLSIIFFFIASAAGQTTSFAPSNDSLPMNMTAPDIDLTLSSSSLNLNRNIYNIAPLTSRAGLGQDGNSLSSLHINAASISLTDATSVGNLTNSDIAYMSCDPNDSSNIDSTAAIIMAGNAKPKAILLYSLYSQECSLSGDSSYGSIYTMISASDSTDLLNAIQNDTSSASLAASIDSNQGSPGSGLGSQTSNNGGPPPTTAVAMSILYSITGIITLLFLVIIATGAIRAHRHPERYGPRNAPGRPRQSRAKGLARAMLETLPIVKFGDPEPVKPGSVDFELENGSVHHVPVTTATNTIADATTKSPTTAAVATSAQLGDGSDTQPKFGDNEASASPKEEELVQCSICTDDFATGEDVRVLPCNHKYHPACIDPWLLNVSGTCPLCRRDLRPTAAEAQVEGDELSPPLDPREGELAGQHTAENGETGSRHRLSRLIRLRNAPPEESIAALRELASEQSQQAGAVQSQDAAEEQSRRARLTGRLRSTFRIRTRQQTVDPTEPNTGT
ncbi:hypothetical protein DSL72_005679 [Monilinia vaccinii-corymbosi]|uniref:RING-type domain-containing protein n=1 Tax=Monilinia vaccinii-corymbosi TaxID=61207 RepID=A0A8A3PGE8_9HELO|nr:hypothetical protein DSL72_005679 [Monilinia vaccinii-corymbosi]